MNLILSVFDSHVGSCVLLGFLGYSLFVLWRRGSARWANWFPLVAKLARVVLYAAAIGLLLLAGHVFLADAFNQQSLAFIAAGGFTAPVLNALVRQFRPKEKIRRGARVATVDVVNRETRRLPAEEMHEAFTIGGVTVPRGAEAYHFLVVGSTGSGKSVCITQLLDHLEARGDIALVVDSGGGFSSRYYQEGRDYILNPFDDRCVPWSPTVEMAGPWDAEALAKSMVPDGVGDSKDWNSYAQTLVTSVLRQLADKGQLSIRDLLYYVQAAPIEELQPLLAGTPAAAQLGSDKTFGSIRTIAANYLATYAYLSDSENPFSISKFIRKEKPGFLFLTYRDDQLDSLRNMISCALDVASRTILALDPSRTRRVWLIIDEFASIGKVQSIEAVATKARKVGGCLLLGLQSVSQLQDRYGDKGAQTILSCLSSWLVLRCSDAETSEYISKYIGETEVSRMTRSESTSDTSGGTDSRNEQINTQRAVMPVELQRLANLQGYFKLAGDYPICGVKLKFPKKRDDRAESYAERDFRAKPMLNLLENRATAPEVASAPTGGVAMAQEPSTQPVTAALVPAEVSPSFTLKIQTTSFEEGPDLLEEVLTDMAEFAEHEA